MPITLACGLTIHGDLRDATWSRLARHGYHEPATERFLSETLRTGDTVIDVGAQVGIFSAIAAKKVGPTGKVFAIDVDPHNLTRLRQTVRRNRLQNVVIVPQALGRGDEEVTFVRPDASWGAFAAPTDVDCRSPSEQFALQPELDRSTHVDRIVSRTISLDSFVERNAIAEIDVVKIDVDGMEFEVLQGASRILNTLRPALTYEDSQYARDRGISFQEVWELLQRNNYRVWGCSRDATDVLPICGPDEEWVKPLIAARQDINLFCLPSDKFDRWAERVWFARRDA